MMGLVFHQGGTISTVLTGATVRPISDRHRVAHEDLAYMVDSTASPAATVIPFNVWPIYVGGLVAGTIPLIPDEQAGIEHLGRVAGFLVISAQPFHHEVEHLVDHLRSVTQRSV